MTDAEFLAALESCALPEPAFDHRNHLRAAWLYLRAHPFPEAIARMSAALKRYTAHLGKPDRYHETVTVAYMAVINERMERTGGGDWTAFLDANTDLLDRRLLTHYYRPETLASAAARRIFLLGEFRERPYESAAAT